MSGRWLDLGKAHFETVKASDLLFMLRSCFKLEDFNRIEKILVARYKTLNDEVQHWNSAYNLMEKRHGEAVLSQLLAEEEINKCRRVLGMQVERTRELEKDNGLCHEKVVVYKEREKRARTEYRKLLENFQRLERENMELVVKNSELDAAKVKVERELESVKESNVEFRLRVTRLEEDIKVLMSGRHVQNTVHEEKDSMDVMNANGASIRTGSGKTIGAEMKEVILNGHGKKKFSVGADCPGTEANQLKDAGVGLVIRPCDEGISIPNKTVLEKGDRFQIEKRQKTDPSVGKFQSGVVIEISDSDDEMPKQNQTPNVPSVIMPGVLFREKETKDPLSEQSDGRNQFTLISKRKRGLFLNNGEKENDGNNNGFSFSDISTSDSDCDTDTIDELVGVRRGSSKLN